MPNVPSLLRDVVRRPWYYANSVWVRAYRRLSRRRQSFNGSVYAKTSLNLRDYDAIVFAFDSPMIHIGDQVFFLPLIFKLAHHGYPVEIQPPKAMVGIYPFTERRDAKRRLYVSRLPVLPRIFREGYDAEFFVIDGQTPIREAIGLYILRVFCEHFSLTDISLDLTEVERQQLALPVPISPRFDDLRDKKVIVFSNYGHSGKFWRSAETAARLCEDARRYKREFGGFVVHVGTAGDRDEDPAQYGDWVDLDLRGKTTVAELFGIFCHVPIHMVFTYDTGVLHMSRMYRRPVRHYWPTRATYEHYLILKSASVHFFDRDVFAAECDDDLTGTTFERTAAR